MNHIHAGLMNERIVKYFDIMFITPARKYFPKVKATQWTWSKFTNSYCIPDGYANMYCRAPSNGGNGE